ncbi:MAG: GAF domain-containing protein [Anaerolineales bacterium]|nr:MAG: GAF domain-containing protein [Anaerolineales bacterium]
MRADIPAFAILTRWALLLALAVQLSITGAGVITIPLLVVALGVWNLWLSLRWLRGQAWPRQDLIEVAVDFIFAVAQFYFSRTVLGPLVWLGMFPVIRAAWTFGLGGGLAAGVLTAAAFAALAAIDVPLAQVPLLMLLPALAFLVVGSLLGFWGRQVDFSVREQQQMGDYQRLETARRDRERAQTLFAITQQVNASLVFEQVLENALDVGSKAFVDPHENVTRTLGAVLLFDEGGLRVAAARHLSAQDLGRVLPGQQGALAQLLQQGEPQQVPMPSKDDEFKLLAGLHNSQSLYALPLVSGLDLFGVLFFAHPEANFFTLERCELAGVIARQLMGALQNAQLYEALTEEKERIAHIQEQARQQLARNLHDGPTQNVAAIAMRINLARRLLAKDAAAASEELYKVEDLSRRTTKEMRFMLFTLRPQALEASGLCVALDDLAKHAEETYGYTVKVEADPEAEARMDRGKQGVVFSIASEALENAYRFAQASNVVVRLSKQDGNISLLEVQDDGAPRPAQTDKLDILQERTNLISGILRLDSAGGKGTRLRVWVPLTEQAADRLRRGEV